MTQSNEGDAKPEFEHFPISNIGKFGVFIDGEKRPGVFFDFVSLEETLRFSVPYLEVSRVVAKLIKGFGSAFSKLEKEGLKADPGGFMTDPFPVAEVSLGVGLKDQIVPLFYLEGGLRFDMLLDRQQAEKLKNALDKALTGKTPHMKGL